MLEHIHVVLTNQPKKCGYYFLEDNEYEATLHSINEGNTRLWYRKRKWVIKSWTNLCEDLNVDDVDELEEEVESVLSLGDEL